MDNRNLNEKESLELIAQMIQNTRYRKVKNAGVPFLIWGYTTIIVSLLVWFVLKETGDYSWQCLWFLLPAIAYPLTVRFSFRRQNVVKTYIDRMVGYVWMVFGMAGFLISCVFIFFRNLPILFIVLLMMGMGTVLTGLIIKMRVVTVCGSLGALASLGCLYVDGLDRILVFASAFVFMMVVPGHYLNSITKRDGM